MNEVFRTAGDQFRQKLPQLTQNQEVRDIRVEREKEIGTLLVSWIPTSKNETVLCRHMKITEYYFL